MKLSFWFNPIISLVSASAIVLLQVQNLTALPLPQVDNAVSPALQVNNAALTAPEVNKIAKQITVRIDGANTGSGVIVNQQGNTYTVLTNMHVVEYAGNYRLQTYDGRVYAFTHKQTQTVSRGVDLAVLEFTTTATYHTAEIGNSDQLNEGMSVYVAGWADPDAISNQRSYRFQDGRIAARITGGRNGYNLVYSNVTKPGMSGGPILDEQGRLVGINGQALTDERIEVTDFYGIPINIYLKFAAENKIPSSNNIDSQKPSLSIEPQNPFLNQDHINNLLLEQTILNNNQNQINPQINDIFIDTNFSNT
ncbi:serine protease [Nostoc sp. CHAB 5844]|nr:serine protease [Nostoc sp. CHAB 5844]